MVARGRHAASYSMCSASMQHYFAVLSGRTRVTPPLAIVRLRVADEGDDDERDVGGGSGGGGGGGGGPGGAGAAAAASPLLDSVTPQDGFPVCEAEECAGALAFRFTFPGHLGSVTVEWRARVVRLAVPTHSEVFQLFVLPLCGATSELSVWGASVVRAATPHAPGTTKSERIAADAALVANAAALWKAHCRGSPDNFRMQTDLASVHADLRRLCVGCARDAAHSFGAATRRYRRGIEGSHGPAPPLLNVLAGSDRNAVMLRRVLAQEPFRLRWSASVLWSARVMERPDLAGVPSLALGTSYRTTPRLVRAGVKAVAVNTAARACEHYAALDPTLPEPVSERRRAAG